MPKQKTEDEFYTSLKENLEQHHNFPEDYLFKFVMPNDSKRLSELYQIFDQTTNTISSRESRNQKYVSYSILCFVLDANQVIDLYKKVAKIDGVVML